LVSRFLRFSELASLQIKNIAFHDSFMSVNVKNSKTDQFSKGYKVCIDSAGNKRCPVSW
jgi:hypothetical protein